MAKSSPLNTLTIAHQDGPLTFKLTNGGYFIDNGYITISIETDGINEDQAVPMAYFCLERAPCKREIRPGIAFRSKSGILERITNVGPRGYAYFGFHAEDVDITFTVWKLGDTSIQFAFKAIHDDPDYYDERAKRTTTTGMFELSEAPPGQLWVPV